MKKILGLIAVVFSVGLTGISHAQEAEITAGDAWTYPNIGAQKTIAGYVTIKSGATADDKLIDATSPFADRIEIHNHSMEEGVMKMRRLEFVKIPAAEEIKFAPGGLHLMIMDLKKDLKSGGVLPITLFFEHALPVDILMAVKERG